MKKCIAEIAPAFTTKRMIDDYKERYYSKLAIRNTLLKNDNYKVVDEIVEWKQRVSSVWDSINIVSVEKNMTTGFKLGEKYSGIVKVDLQGLKPEDINFEFVLSEQSEAEEREIVECHPFIFSSMEGNVAVYTLDVLADRAGLFNYGIRMYPSNNISSVSSRFPIRTLDLE
jgi:hypothetical protein